MAPFALAIERSIESKIYQKLIIEPPILDLGCGDGLFAHLVFDEKIDTGIDPNPRELTRAGELGGYRELIQCYGASIPRPDASYNTVISNSVLEHIPELQPVFREIFRILVPGGFFYFTVPTHLFEKYSAVSRLLRAFKLHQLALRYERFYNEFWHQYNCFPPETWREIIESHGFQVTDIYTYDPQKICTINDLLVPFSFFSYVMKKFFNRWILLPRLRRLWAPLFMPAIAKLIERADKSDDGCLVFISARKGVRGES
jgi:SAM-dependent methyltransferase